jgi:hypothetical protein
MSEPFTQRSKYPLRAFIGKESFGYLLSRLSQLGFSEQKVILPQLIVKNEKMLAGPEKKDLTAQEFLDSDEDFKSIVLQSKNNEGEEIAILFKNDLTNRISFNSNIYSVVEEIPKSNLYISTYDPIRTYGLMKYLEDFFRDKVINPGLRNFLLFLAVLPSPIPMYFAIKKPTNTWAFITAVVVMFLWVVAVSRFLPKSGLQVSSIKKNAYPAYIEELRKSWLIILTASILAFIFGLLGNYIAKLFGWT